MLAWMKDFITRLISFFSARDRDLVGRARKPLTYSTKIFSNRSLALQAISAGRVLAVVESEGNKKWALMRCPCGCGEDLALNLMRSHFPAWELIVNNAGQASLHPSVHATRCGAHFWVKNGTVNWCE